MTTWNSADKSATVTLSGGNLTATSSTGVSQSVRSTTSKAAGKFYFEATFPTVTADCAIGLATASESLSVPAGLGSDANGLAFYPVSPPSGLYVGGSFIGQGGTASTNGTVICVAVDFTARKIWVSSNVTIGGAKPWNPWGSGTPNPALGTGGESIPLGALFVMFNDDLGGAVCTINFGASAFTQAVPSGFSGWDSGAVVVPVAIVPGGTSAFFVIEASVHQGFTDPTGNAEFGYNTTPMLALEQVETAGAANTTFYASDAGYRTLASDPQGVVAYPPTIVEAFSVDVAANLDPTGPAVAAAWGTLTLNNMDHGYDALMANWSSDGQAITIYRGLKTFDTVRNIFLDPAYATLVQVFKGVMGPWKPDLNVVKIDLRDASYYLEKQVPRNTYGGSGGLDGAAELAGTTKPLTLGGLVPPRAISNVTPLLIDSTNLVYQFNDGSGVPYAVYDGGVALTIDPAVTDVYSGSTPSGHVRNDFAHGVFQLGSAPVFDLTADVWANPLGTTSTVKALVLYALSSTNWLAVPSSLIGGYGSLSGIDSYGVDTTLTATALALNVGIYVAGNESIDGITLINKLLAGSGALLVPGRDGALRLLVLSAIPGNATSALVFDNSNIVSIEPQDLPESISPPPWRIRLAYNRVWTVQTGTLAGATAASRRALVGSGWRVASAVGTPTSQSSYARLSDPDVIGTAGGSLQQSASSEQPVVNGMIALWGTTRRLYDITVPASVGLFLDWASIVTVISDFDNLGSPGKLGQIVGWRYSNEDATSVYRVLV